MKTTHTPGPWSSVSSLGLVRTDDTGKIICALPHALNKRAIKTRRAGDPAEITPDAKLIAAAPELLAALNECADELAAACERATGPENAANRYNLRKRAELARAAIAKATQ
jgi:hypothetical protein